MRQISAPAKRRLVLLERLLSNCTEQHITSQKIQEATGWSAAVVRRDISLLELHSGASNGYPVEELRECIRSTLNLSLQEQKCCIVGLGRMGQAILGTTELENSNYKMVAGFDSNVNRTEVLKSNFPLHPTTRLEYVIRSEGIEYAILAVEKQEAQSIASRLCECGVKGIVNYTSCMLTVPSTTKVENVSLLTALETLSAQNAEI